MIKKLINIVWFKRDLRFTDHEPLFMAQQQIIPTLLLYFFEPAVMNYDDAAAHHCRFINESLQELQTKLKSIATKICIFHSEVQSVFDQNNIHWQQSQMHGVIRKLKSRSDWAKRWKNIMRATYKIIDLNAILQEFERLKKCTTD